MAKDTYDLAQEVTKSVAKFCELRYPDGFGRYAFEAGYLSSLVRGMACSDGNVVFLERELAHLEKQILILEKL